MERVIRWLFVGILILSFLAFCQKNRQLSDISHFNNNSTETITKITVSLAMNCLSILGLSLFSLLFRIVSTLEYFGCLLVRQTIHDHFFTGECYAR